MKQVKNPYKPFPNFVLRAPLLPLEFFLELTKGNEVTDAQLLEAMQDPVLQEAISLASPSLTVEMHKWLEGGLNDAKRLKRLHHSLLKYLSRMASRCTPFGLFAGCAVGEYAEHSALTPMAHEGHKKHTRLDMNYLVALSQDLVKRPAIRQALKFYPNTSLYLAGDQYRYVEYYYVGAARVHNMVGVEHSDYLAYVLEQAEGGASLETLAQSLVGEAISGDEAMGYINALVDGQVLVSALEPAVCGPDFLEQIIAVVARLEGQEPLLGQLKGLQESLARLDARMGQSVDAYEALKEEIKLLGTGFDTRYLLQTDLELAVEGKPTLSYEVPQALGKALELFCRISPRKVQTNLSDFAAAFTARYGEREVPLATALDVEIGLGYPAGQGGGDVNPLIAGLKAPPAVNKNPAQPMAWTRALSIIHKRLMTALEAGDYTIVLTDADFAALPCEWHDMPETLNCMVRVALEDGVTKMRCTGSGGLSAANLLGRFCHSFPGIDAMTHDITGAEAKMHPNELLAEVVHLPLARAGNVLMRPSLRDFEIPYLAQSLKAGEQQLPIQELQVAIRKGRVVLRSVKHNKEVIPHLSTAHNYPFNSLPLYHFLCDLQTQHVCTGPGFGYGPLAGEYSFLPRVEYHNVILREAMWNLYDKDLAGLRHALRKNPQGLMAEMASLRERLKIPAQVLLVDGDNELLMNLENQTMAEVFAELTKKNSHVVLAEHIYTHGSPVNNGKGHFANQMVVAFYRDDLLNTN